MRLRYTIKQGLAAIGGKAPASGITVLIYHRVGGGSDDERDVPLRSFESQLGILSNYRIVSLDDALDGLDSGDRRHKVVITFDDGFGDVSEHAWPLLAARQMPFTLYLATAFIDGEMTWAGSTARGTGAGLTRSQLAKLAASPLCTIGNHTHTHARPELVDEAEIDRCSDVIESIAGSRPRHFAFTWGVAVPGLDEALRARFRSAATGVVGRNLPGCDYMRLRRIPVRSSDPPDFFAAKLRGNLFPERAYGALTRSAKRVMRRPGAAAGPTY